MVFKKTTPDGEADPRINRKGRAKNKPKSRREIRGDELLSLLRKVKPHVAQAIKRAATIMQNEQASHAAQLKAAVILLDNYRTLVGDVYGNEVDSDEEGEEVQGNNLPTFSLKVVGTE